MKSVQNFQMENKTNSVSENTQNSNLHEHIDSLSQSNKILRIVNNKTTNCEKKITSTVTPLERKQQEKINQLININSDIPRHQSTQNSDDNFKMITSENTEFKKANKKKSKNNNRRTTIGVNTEKCEITAVESRHAVFVSRLDPNT